MKPRIGGQGDLGSSFEVNHASAQNTPGLFSRVALSAAMGADLGLAKDAKISGLASSQTEIMSNVPAPAFSM